MCILDTKHMDGPAPARETCNDINGSSHLHNLEQPRYKDESNNMQAGSTMNMVAGAVEQLKPLLQSSTDVDSNLGGTMQQSELKKAKRGRPRGKRVLSRLECRTYSLRSSLDGGRVLRSMSNVECKDKDPHNTNSNAGHLNTVNTKKRKRRNRRNHTVIDEFARIKQRVRYILSRMSYEQSLIEAYSGEGWRGLSQEKLRPEKELQRAMSEILRCKLRVRENFQRIDSLCSEGKFQLSLFDSEGQINAEDIYCAKCGLKDLSVNNDIILCDGACDRGFHQKCLTPPLSNEEIPPGDESWLCPGCNCKIGCIELLNEILGTDLSIEDKWEKVFPEAAASASKDEQYDDLGLPSDDSEDDDYDPDHSIPTGEISKEESSSEECDSSSASDDSSASIKDEPHDRSMLSSDSEDDDYDPSAPEINKNFQKAGSSSDESEFSSDTDDLNFFVGGDSDSPKSDAMTRGPLEDHSDPTTESSKQRSKMNVGKRKLVNSELQSLLEQDSSGEIAAPISGKRQYARMDYKKLHDETYGDISSDSSGDEDWKEMSFPQQEENDWAVPSKGSDRTVQDRQLVAEAQSLPVVKDAVPEPIIDVVGLTDKSPKKTFVTKDDDDVKHSNKQEDNAKLNRRGNKASRSGCRGFGPVVSQRLAESFRENAYPTKVTREHLAKELGITILQVSTWFANARRNLSHSATKEMNKAAEKMNKAAENTPLGDQINGKVELGTKTISNAVGNVLEDIERSKTEITRPILMRLGDDIVNHDEKAVEPRAAAVSCFDSEGKLIGNKAGVILNSSTMGTVPTPVERRKVAVSRRCWDSAKYESRKRRMEILNGSPNTASNVGGKLSKAEAAGSPQVQQSPKKGKNASCYASSSKVESSPNTTQNDNPYAELKIGKADDQSQIDVPQRQGQTARASTSGVKGASSPVTVIGGLAGGPIEHAADGNEAALPPALQHQKKGQNATPYRSSVETRSRRAIT